jgi:hypothetical protein
MQVVPWCGTLLVGGGQRLGRARDVQHLHPVKNEDYGTALWQFSLALWTSPEKVEGFSDN